MSRISRRNLLKASLAAPVLSLPQLVPGWAKGRSPSETLNIAAIGVGGRGRADLDGCAHEKIVALCDADSTILAGAAQTYTTAKTYADFRVMFDEMENDIDAVVVGTPDHTHAAPGCAAMARGKHLYCEKPLAHDLYEIRTMTDLAKKHGLVTQLGTQIHAEKNYRRVVELVQSGAIGAIRKVDVWFGGSYAGGKPSTEKPPVPEQLNWDLWLGPALYRPYHPQYVPFRWR
ncbi:MAG: Gfo/Idh/MocA family oxidoreductase, partial [Planctomycetia bacterium]|nr:Gfo/Idh/MocA family oxidoreductase [Planctomycetia bacterium]